MFSFFQKIIDLQDLHNFTTFEPKRERNELFLYSNKSFQLLI